MDFHRARPRRRRALPALAPWRAFAVAAAALSLAACAGGSFAGVPGRGGGATSSAGRSVDAALPSALALPAGFHGKIVANVGGARELVALPNGDLLVGTSGKSVVIVPGIDGTAETATPATFATLSEGPAEGVSFGGGYVFVGTEHAVWRIPYATGAQSGTPQQIAALRTGSVAPNSDGDVHHSTSVAVRGVRLEVGVGSSCNACAEVDPTRATVQAMNLDGSAMETKAKRFRNPIAMALDDHGVVWAGGAGQDNLAQGHPYEFLDPVSTHPAPADYGWPACEENHVAYTAGADCSAVVVPAIEFPAYSTLIGAAYYSSAQTGAHVFPAAWRGGMFVSVHGSWHTLNGVPAVAPHVAFVPFAANGTPARTVNWSNPSAQWNEFLTGFQSASGSRSGRPSGVAVGPSGSLFVADDQTGNIYRIRPNEQ